MHSHGDLQSRLRPFPNLKDLWAKADTYSDWEVTQHISALSIHLERDADNKLPENIPCDKIVSLKGYVDCFKQDMASKCPNVQEIYLNNETYGYGHFDLPVLQQIGTLFPSAKRIHIEAGTEIYFECDNKIVLNQEDLESEATILRTLAAQYTA